MRSFLEYLDGKRIYLVSAILFLGVLVLAFFGRISPTTAVPLLVISGFAFEFRSTLQQHHDQVLALLVDIAAAGAAYQKHDKKALATAADLAAVDGETLVTEIHTEAK